MSNEMFNRPLRLGNPIMAQGKIKKEYNPAVIYVGIVQLEPDASGQPMVVAGSYGYGPGSVIAASAGETLNAWSMLLEPDGDDSRRELRPSLKGNSDTFGFVLAQLPSGRLTGWVDPGIELLPPEAAPATPPASTQGAG
jgi:hypothetical protein